MKKLATIVMLFGLIGLLSDESWAIGVRTKSSAQSQSAPADTAGQASRRQPRPSKATLLEKLKRDVREAQKRTQPNATDNYIDANDDGVDDRVKDKAKVERPKIRTKQVVPASDTSQSTTKKKRNPR